MSSIMEQKADDEIEAGLQREREKVMGLCSFCFKELPRKDLRPFNINKDICKHCINKGEENE